MTTLPKDPTDLLVERFRDAGLTVHDIREQLASKPGVGAAPWGLRTAAGLRGVVYHHMAGEHPSGRTLQHVYAIHAYHTSPQNHITGDPVKGAGKGRGMYSIVYWLLFLGDGSVAVTQSILNRTYAQADTAQAGDENSMYVGCGFLGDLSSPGHTAGEPTFGQLSALHTVQAVFMRVFGWTAATAYCHADFGKPACPGETVRRVVSAWRASASLTGTGSEADLSTWKGRQQALMAVGYPLPRFGADGKYAPGGETFGALQQFQRDYGLKADGRWGPLTELKMREQLALKAT